MAGKIGSYFSRFPKVFWVSMTFELFERGAYYTFTPIIAWHAYVNVGLPLWLASIIFTFIWPIQYGLPILSGALVEKVGYRKQIIVAFIILTIAYFSLSRASTGASLILSVIALGFGIGTYKPLISAIVAKVTTSKDRTYAFGIYYWIVNIAAGIFPIGFAIAEVQGYIHVGIYNIIFLVGAVLVSFNLLIAIFIFEDVPRSEKVKTVADALNNIKISIKDRKFLVLVLLTAVFWALYSTQLTGVIVIIFGYRFVPEWFTLIIYAIFNPMTIVIAGPFLSKYIEKVESIRVMIAGVLVYILGLTVLGFGITDWKTVVSGIVVMSIGEFMVAPGFYSFTSKLATEDKVSAYIGSTFIASFIGLPLGSFVFGLLVAYIAEIIMMPFLFFGLMITFCLLLFIAFIIYYQKWGQDVIERAKRIAEEEEGKKIETDRNYIEPLIFRLYETKTPILISVVLIPIILFATFSMGTYTFYGREEGPVEVPTTDWSKYAVNSGLLADDGYLAEGDTYNDIFNITDPNVISVTVTLSWTDEPDANARVTNQPDSFSLTLTPPRGQDKSSQSSSGSVSVSVSFEPYRDPYYNGSYEYAIIVECTDAGDQEPIVPDPLNLRTVVDNGNNWELTIEYEYYETKVTG